MQIVKIFSALLVAACAAQTFSTHAHAAAPSSLIFQNVAVRSDSSTPACRSARTYHYTYREHSRRYYPGAKARARRPRRKFPTN
jgi:hypothetical protein